VGIEERPERKNNGRYCTAAQWKKVNFLSRMDLVGGGAGSAPGLQHDQRGFFAIRIVESLSKKGDINI
jgi:hypothetical protein